MAFSDFSPLTIWCQKPSFWPLMSGVISKNRPLIQRNIIAKTTKKTTTIEVAQMIKQMIHCF
ncbi:MAG: hypothetical protein B5M56_02110 [Desulfococcus sp. 4484_241]|nr:MAG: hypothetical protein B5M56_02110 [Desulfococcus sp. 4484_241]